MRKETVSYDKGKIIEVIKDLNVLVVSLDRIGSAWSDRESDAEYNAMFMKFSYDFKFFEKLAAARYVLEEPFSDVAGDDGRDELERQMQDLKYWGDNPASNEL